MAEQTNTTTIADGFATVSIEVNKKEVVAGKPQYKPVGKINIFVPLLAAFGLTTEQAKDDKGALLVDDDGLPVYTDDKLNYLQGAVTAAVKAQARNRLKPGTADLKDGAKIATNFEELLAAADRSNSGAALVAIRELKAKFSAWVASLGKSAAAQATLNTLFGNKQALALQTAQNREKMQQYISDFAETLEADMLERGGKYLQSLLDACSASAEADDF